ncbi:MAG: TetR family transcriptional regulator [Lacunisphaera sp.]
MRSKTRPPGLKPSSFIEEARKKQIIDATIAAVAETGYAGASLAKLAARAKISKSIISYHFVGKDALLEQTVHQIYQEIWNAVRPRLLAETTAAGQLQAYIEAEFAYLEINRAQLLTLSYILMNHRDRHGRLYLHDAAEKENLATLGRMLEEGQKSGEFRTFAVLPMAATLMHSINGALGQWAADPKLSLANYARELVTIFDLATRKQPGSRKPSR